MLVGVNASKANTAAWNLLQAERLRGGGGGESKIDDNTFKNLS